MRLKLISDGSRRNTRIVNERGEEVEGITEIEWHFSQKESSTYAIVTIGDVPCEAVAIANPMESDISNGIL